jgi:glycosyltransferase involved in cell wall biosynthesis
MSTLGIFTLKRLCCHEGRYYTYGGFGDYLAAMRANFEHVIIVAHIRDMLPPHGHFEIPSGPDLEFVGLPQVRSEVGTWLIMPLVFLRAWQASKRMDVVHARMPNYTGVIGAFVSRIRNIPVFNQIVADWYVEAQRMPIFRKFGLGLLMKLNMYFYDWLERLVCKGQMVFAQGQTSFDKHAPVSDCVLALSSAHYLVDIVNPKPRFTQPTKTILNVARLNAVKNQALILKALKVLRAANEDWQVVFVGEGPQREPLDAMAKSLGISQYVTFAGQVNRGDALWHYYDQADCFVLSSRSEGTPKVLLEAMARGLPVVASAVAGVPTSVKHEERGLLFADEDVVGLVAELRRMATDSALREYMVANANVFCTQHTVEESTRLMLDKVFRRWPYLKSPAAKTQ